MVSSLLRRLARVSYGAFLPLDNEAKLEGASSYLTDAWKSLPPQVALAHTVLCAVVFFLPLFLFPYFRPLSILPSASRDQYVKELLTSKIYLFRLVGYGVKGHALVAILREPAAREALKAVPELLARRAV